MLQWGRGFAATEGWWARLDMARQERASMGPWLRSHGREPLTGRGDDGRLASMGPWLRSHGRRVTLRFSRCWPNCFNGAVASQPRKEQRPDQPVAVPVKLQWGRGFAATEGSEVVSGRRSTETLQWGRGFAATEGLRVLTMAKLVRRASMGPWLRSHGRGRVGGGEVAVRHRFNGAVASQPRKVTTGREV